MGLVIETDLGGDPDDFFALCYLMSAGVDIAAILLYPGYPDQVALARFLCGECGLRPSIGAGSAKQTRSISGFHETMLRRHGAPLAAESDGDGCDILARAMSGGGRHELLVIGPPRSTGRYLRSPSHVEFERATIQGGFIAYDVHGVPCRRVSELAHAREAQSYNLNGNLPGTRALLAAPMERRFVSKNVNHRIVYDRARHASVRAIPPSSRAAELFREAGDVLLNSGRAPKKFHDPNAAVCHLHPDIATWVRARLYQARDRNFVTWGATLDDAGDAIIVDVDTVRLWQHLAEGS